ncbi:GlsB/YeaQ/YmgE family stress response membrane protein [Actinoplanes sp. NPDC051851]|uniref:GlsB/YeaQ/YmgE family stress response membrane protein n=1 Tax=Actinoplanes sp. NPDC051851 TaxID=3154753 RepID=UPI003412A4C2
MDAQDLIAAIVIGAIIGIVARIILPGRQNIGIIPTVLIGMAAAVAGTWASQRWDVHSDKLFTVSGHHFDWAVVAVQIGIAIVGVAIAAVLAKTFSTDRIDD